MRSRVTPEAPQTPVPAVPAVPAPARPARTGPVHADDSLERLRKIEGQVRGIQHMIERHERCTEVLAQLAAARAALGAVAVGLVDEQLRRTLHAAGADVDIELQADADESLAAVRLLLR